MARASVDFGLGTVVTCGLNNFKESLKKRWKNTTNKFNNYNELISYQLGFHAEYTTSRELLRGISALAQKYKKPCFHTFKQKQKVRLRSVLNDTEKHLRLF